MEILLSKYPNLVPVLTDKEFRCTNSSCGKSKRHCMMEWITTVFAPRAFAEMNRINNWDLYDNTFEEVPQRVYDTVLHYCVKVAGREPNKYYIGTSSKIIYYNDQVFEAEQLAVVWNKSMRKLGYVVEV